jgi:exodeoxyribonuclease III
MKMQKNSDESNISVLCWNIANPSVERAAKQADWLKNRSETVIVLTETKKSEGCLMLERFFKSFIGWKVVFLKPEENEYGVMIISRHPIQLSWFCQSITYLQSRCVSVKLEVRNQEIEVIGVYVPSRDSSAEKIEKKKAFLNQLRTTLDSQQNLSKIIFCGDFNILEPNHKPHYSFFEEWEYNFYNIVCSSLRDAFRHFNPTSLEYSWIGRKGDGYRYDHSFISPDLLPFARNCTYVHEPRLMKLSDHSAVTTTLFIP